MPIIGTSENARGFLREVLNVLIVAGAFLIVLGVVGGPVHTVEAVRVADVVPDDRRDLDFRDLPDQPT